MSDCNPLNLREEFIQAIQATLETPQIKNRILAFSDEYSSFEHWFNWEVFHAFQAICREKKYSIQRELRYPKPSLGLADIALSCDKITIDNKDVIRIESKLIWDNSIADKCIESAVRDAERIVSVGIGLLVIIAVSAGKSVKNQAWPPIIHGSPVELISKLQVRLTSLGMMSEPQIIFQHDASADSDTWVSPQVRIAVYRVG